MTTRSRRKTTKSILIGDAGVLGHPLSRNAYSDAWASVASRVERNPKWFPDACCGNSNNMDKEPVSILLISDWLILVNSDNCCCVILRAWRALIKDRPSAYEFENASSGAVPSDERREHNLRSDRGCVRSEREVKGN